eukprot:scaffold476_cov120-Cylindrotheca_fusiformis.AAC.1
MEGKVMQSLGWQNHTCVESSNDLLFYNEEVHKQVSGLFHLDFSPAARQKDNWEIPSDDNENPKYIKQWSFVSHHGRIGISDRMILPHLKHLKKILVDADLQFTPTAWAVPKEKKSSLAALFTSNPAIVEGSKCDAPANACALQGTGVASSNKRETDAVFCKGKLQKIEEKEQPAASNNYFPLQLLHFAKPLSTESVSSCVKHQNSAFLHHRNRGGGLISVGCGECSRTTRSSNADLASSMIEVEFSPRPKTPPGQPSKSKDNFYGDCSSCDHLSCQLSVIYFYAENGMHHDELPHGLQVSISLPAGNLQ